MVKRLSIVTFHRELKKLIEKNTSLKCYDGVPTNTVPPFVYLEITGKRDKSSKTMYLETISVWIHIWAKASSSSIGIYNLIQEVEEGLCERLCLGEGFHVVGQSNAQLNVIDIDETREKHAIVEYDFDVCYGYKVK